MGRHVPSVGQFGFTVTLQGHFIGLGGETGRVKETNRGEGTRDGVDGESLQEFRRSLVGIVVGIAKESLVAAWYVPEQLAWQQAWFVSKIHAWWVDGLPTSRSCSS